MIKNVVVEKSKFVTLKDVPKYKAIVLNSGEDAYTLTAIDETTFENIKIDLNKIQDVKVRHSIWRTVYYSMPP